jgi:hypothetical protein
VDGISSTIDRVAANPKKSANIPIERFVLTD